MGCRLDYQLDLVTGVRPRAQVHASRFASPLSDSPEGARSFRTGSEHVLGWHHGELWSLSVSSRSRRPFSGFDQLLSSRIGRVLLAVAFRRSFLLIIAFLPSLLSCLLASSMFLGSL